MTTLSHINAIQRITVNENKKLRYTSDRDLSSGYLCLPFEEPEPGLYPFIYNYILPLSYLTERSHSFYYYFDGYTGKHWSAHDPMGRTEPNQKKNVVDPHGNIFIRAEWQRHSNKTTHISFRGD